MDKRDQTALGQKIRSRALRKIRAKSTGERGVWFGLGMMGLIGWSVTVPTLLGAALGFWMDKRFHGRFSWTLMLLTMGLVVGCFNAWHWVRKESAEMEEEEEDIDD